MWGLRMSGLAIGRLGSGFGGSRDRLLTAGELILG